MTADTVFAEALRQFGAGRMDEAERLCRSALALDPAHGRSQHLLGLIAFRSGRDAQAIVLLTAALGANDRDPALHSNLANAFARAGRSGEAREHYERAIALKPDHLEAHYNLGNLLAGLGSWNEAVASYRRALALRPDYVDAWTNLAHAHLALGAAAQALADCDKALALDPRRPLLHANRGLALAALDRFDEAMASYDQALVLDPAAAEVYGNIGTALVERGRIDEAIGWFDRGLALAPRNAKLHFCRVQARRVTGGDPQIAALETLARDQAGLGDEARIDLHFALAKAYMDLGRASDAFALLATGNALKRRHTPYDEAATLARLDRIAGALSRGTLERLSGAGNPSPRPIFILGMPRSGSTLVEQILASHPAVAAGGELPNLPEAVTAILGPDQDFPSPALPIADQRAALRGIGDRYLASLEAVASGTMKAGAERITDKMPSNFALAGLIHLVLPKARIIHTRRDPLDVGLSCYATLFTGLPYAYDLGEIGRYIRACDTLMRHWRSVLPADAILDVDYEALIADFETEARRIIAFCGLPWDKACLSFQSAPRTVKTASAAQVRQPLYHGSVARWRTLDPGLLQPLREALGLLALRDGKS